MTDIKFGVIADDFTGAMDTGCQFAMLGLTTTLNIKSQVEGHSRTAVINTASREVPAEVAIKRVIQAAKKLPGRRLFKKIDSTLRGHVGAEVTALLEASDAPKAVVCPVLIEEDRRVYSGELFVGGIPLHESAFSNDPAWPARTSRLDELLGLSACSLPLEVVRAGKEGLAHAMKNAANRVIIPDAQTQADLATIAQTTSRLGYLPCGALGLARAWVVACMDTNSPIRGEVAMDISHPVLFLAGTRHPATREQLRLLQSEVGIQRIQVLPRPLKAPEGRGEWSALASELRHGRSAILMTPDEEILDNEERGRVREAMSRLALRACLQYNLGGLVLLGGETAGDILQKMNASAVQILDEFRIGEASGARVPGRVPYGRLVGGHAPGLAILSKAGGFGPPDTLFRLWDTFATQGGNSTKIYEEKGDGYGK